MQTEAALIAQAVSSSENTKDDIVSAEVHSWARLFSGKYLARKGSKVLGHIGARGTSYWNVRLLDCIFDFDEIRVHSKRPESQRAFAETLAADLGKPIREVGTWEDCVRDADIVVEASRLPAPEPLLRTEWIKRGAVCVNFSSEKNFKPDVRTRASMYLPAIGKTTIAMLQRNLLRLVEYRELSEAADK